MKIFRFILFALMIFSAVPVTSIYAATCAENGFTCVTGISQCYEIRQINKTGDCNNGICCSGGGSGSGGDSGGSGGNSGGSVSTNIDSQVSGFFAYKTLDNFLPNLLQIALILGSIIAFAFLIWGAIDYIMSGGNQERLKTSKSMIGNAIAGLAILAAVWVIWRIITYFLGLSPTIDGPIKFKFPKP